MMKSGLFRLCAKAPLALLFLLPVAAMAGNDDEGVQKYLCITDRAVGLQTSKNSKERYAGAIRVSPELEKFFVTIGKPQYVPERCFSAETMQGLENELHNKNNIVGPPYGLLYFTNSCLARNVLKVDTGELSTSFYYSTAESIFLDKVGDRFWMTNDGKFSWTLTKFTDAGANDYMFEGRCELIQ